MAITTNWDASKSFDELKVKTQEIHERILAALIMAGEEFVEAARNQPQSHEDGFYIDRTTNLRNSIGFFVFKDGELMHESETRFPDENRAAIQSMIKPAGYQLIGIAGMEYAGYVEAKGYNVITLQADACIVNIREYMDDIKQFINK